MKSKTYIIGIAGASGSGKTTFAIHLAQKFSKYQPLLITQDSYYKDLSNLNSEKRAQQNFDHPSSLDFELLKKHIQELKVGKTIEQPIYNFSNHSRELNTLKAKPSTVLIIEGTLLLSQLDIVAECDTTVYIIMDEQTCYNRRLQRDLLERGRTEDEVIKQYEATVKPMYELFIKPNENAANHIITGNNTQEDIAELYTSILKDLKNIDFNLQYCNLLNIWLVYKQE